MTGEAHILTVLTVRQDCKFKCKQSYRLHCLPLPCCESRLQALRGLVPCLLPCPFDPFCLPEQSLSKRLPQFPSCAHKPLWAVQSCSMARALHSTCWPQRCVPLWETVTSEQPGLLDSWWLKVQAAPAPHPGICHQASFPFRLRLYVSHPKAPKPATITLVSSSWPLCFVPPSWWDCK